MGPNRSAPTWLATRPPVWVGKAIVDLWWRWQRASTRLFRSTHWPRAWWRCRQHPAIRVWAVTRQEWRPLALDARALDGPGDNQSRADPAGEALVAGRDFYYVERTDVGARTLDRLHVVEHAQRIVLTTENVTAIRAALVTLFEPGALQMATVLSNDGPSAWSFYEISRAGADSSSFVAGYQSAYLNRLEAMRRYMAGLPTDRDPPIAPW